MQTVPLSNRHTHTIGKVFQHPASHNLEWRDVVAMIEHLGTVQQENGHLVFTVNGVSQVFPRSPEKQVSEIQQVLDLRHFLERAGVDKDGENVTEASDPPLQTRRLVVISRKEAIIFRPDAKDSVPERLHPHDPTGALDRLIHTEGVDRAARAPEYLAFYKAIAETLRGVAEVLLMGNGTGASSAMAQLQDYLIARYPRIADHIVETLTVDVEALSEEELLQLARTFFLHRDGADNSRA